MRVQAKAQNSMRAHSTNTVSALRSRPQALSGTEGLESLLGRPLQTLASRWHNTHGLQACVTAWSGQVQLLSRGPFGLSECVPTASD